MNRSNDIPSSLAIRRRAADVALIILLIAVVPTLSWGQGLKKVPFPYSPIGLNCLPWFVAKDARLSEKYGIDLDPVFIGASSALFQSMLSGAAEMAGSGGPAIISNILAAVTSFILPRWCPGSRSR